MSDTDTDTDTDTNTHTRKHAAHHDSVGAHRERLHDLARRPDAPVGNHWNIKLLAKTRNLVDRYRLPIYMNTKALLRRYECLY